MYWTGVRHTYRWPIVPGVVRHFLKPLDIIGSRISGIWVWNREARICQKSIGATSGGEFRTRNNIGHAHDIGRRELSRQAYEARSQTSIFRSLSDWGLDGRDRLGILVHHWHGDHVDRALIPSLLHSRHRCPLILVTKSWLTTRSASITALSAACDGRSSVGWTSRRAGTSTIARLGSEERLRQLASLFRNTNKKMNLIQFGHVVKVSNWRDFQNGQTSLAR